MPAGVARGLVGLVGAAVARRGPPAEPRRAAQAGGVASVARAATSMAGSGRHGSGGGANAGLGARCRLPAALVRDMRRASGGASLIRRAAPTEPLSAAGAAQLLPGVPAAIHCPSAARRLPVRRRAPAPAARPLGARGVLLGRTSAAAAAVAARLRAARPHALGSALFGGSQLGRSLLGRRTLLGRALFGGGALLGGGAFLGGTVLGCPLLGRPRERSSGVGSASDGLRCAPPNSGCRRPFMFGRMGFRRDVDDRVFFGPSVGAVVGVDPAAGHPAGTRQARARSRSQADDSGRRRRGISRLARSAASSARSAATSSAAWARISVDSSRRSCVSTVSSYSRRAEISRSSCRS